MRSWNARSAQLSHFVPALGLVLLAGLARAEEDPAGYWGNTISVSATAELPGYAAWHPGTMLLALLVVIGLMFALAWIMRRTGWPTKPPATSGPETKIIYYVRFNARQTLMLLETEQTVRLVVLRGRQVELMTDLPAWKQSGHPLPDGAARPAGRRKTFQEIWQQCLRAAKRPRA